MATKSILRGWFIEDIAFKIFEKSDNTEYDDYPMEVP